MGARIEGLLPRTPQQKSYYSMTVVFMGFRLV
jgi:hypothetical protein